MSKVCFKWWLLVNCRDFGLGKWLCLFVVVIFFKSCNNILILVGLFWRWLNIVSFLVKLFWFFFFCRFLFWWFFCFFRWWWIRCWCIRVLWCWMYWCLGFWWLLCLKLFWVVYVIICLVILLIGWMWNWVCVCLIIWWCCFWFILSYVRWDKVLFECVSWILFVILLWGLFWCWWLIWVLFWCFLGLCGIIYWFCVWLYWVLFCFMYCCLFLLCLFCNIVWIKNFNMALKIKFFWWRVLLAYKLLRWWLWNCRCSVNGKINWCIMWLCFLKFRMWIMWLIRWWVWLIKLWFCCWFGGGCIWLLMVILW